MTARTAARLAWSLWGLAMALEVAGILLWLPNHAALADRFGTTEDSVPTYSSSPATPPWGR